LPALRTGQTLAPEASGLLSLTASEGPALTTSAPVTLPAAQYRNDPVQWEAERRSIFAKSWQFFGHESQLAETGQWLAETLAGYPIVVVRDEAGVLRGYHNVCRHRAGPLTDGPSGKCDGALVCRYHGWTYALDGRLRAARDFGPSAGFDPREYGLYPVRVECWRGLVFVAMDAEIAALAEWVAPLERRVAGRGWGEVEVALQRRHRIACNWKTYVENYLEGYHVPTIHPSLDAEIDSARYTVTMDGLVALHEAPTRGEAPVYGGLWAWLWPNLGVNVYAEGLMMERMSPVGPAECRLDYLYLMPKGVSVSAETLAMSDVVTAEDVSIAEAVQLNLDAGIYDTGRLSLRHETAVAAFQTLVSEHPSEQPRTAEIAARA
jgi:choline monooxygenase